MTNNNNKTILLLTIIATTILITGTLSADQLASAADNKKIIVKTRDGLGEKISAVCTVEWTDGKSNPFQTGSTGRGVVFVPGDVMQATVTCENETLQGSTTSDLNVDTTTTVFVILEEDTQPEPDVIEEILSEIENLQSQIDAIRNESTKTRDVMRFDSTDEAPFVDVAETYFNHGINIGRTDAHPNIFRLSSSMIGIDGEITEFRYDIGKADFSGTTVTATVYKNNSPTNVTCDAISGPPTSCTFTGSLPVSAGDLIAVADVTTAPQPMDVNSRHVTVVITSSAVSGGIDEQVLTELGHTGGRS